MSLHKFRFLEALSTVSPVYNALLIAGDKITDMFAKLQGLLVVRSVKAAITADVSGGASSTADINILQMTIPANTLAVSDSVHFSMSGIFTKPISAGTTITWWVKVGGVRVYASTLQPTSSQTSIPWRVEGEFTARSVGGTASMSGSGTRISQNTTGGQLHVGNGSPITADTTAPLVVTLGFQFSNSNASNNVTTRVATVFLR